MSELKAVSMKLSKKSLNNVEEISEMISESNRTRVISTSLEVAKTILTILKTSELIIRHKNGDEQKINFIAV